MACPGPEIKMRLVLEVYVASLVAMTSRSAIVANLDLRVLAGDPVVAERELEIEVFPVGFLAGGNEIWLAWESVESGDRFLQDERGFLRAESLAAISVSYYSRHDEDCFFHWLGRMECVTKFYGRGKVLLIVIDRASVTRVELMELLGFFHRYGLDMKQLREFDWSEFSDWFRDENAYWHDRVFA